MERIVKSFYPDKEIHKILVLMYGKKYSNSNLNEIIKIGINNIDNKKKPFILLKKEEDELFDRLRKLQSLIPIAILRESIR